ncbi:hypothetical protein RMR10_023845 (plasmid) [Agrobacterium rosae]|uniref:hypothetical protein n=1 Tax=Agrobacterium rosae TaxID=1972867 RepID=UPI002A11ECFD|nr:hypothetical protein [Agrobacterium rosae]MDX8317186.1 hypothetical protein [Agrobacterium rosae]
MSLLLDWQKFTAEAVSFSEGHFANLLKDHHSDGEIDQIYAFHPNAEGASERLKSFLRDTEGQGYRFPKPEWRDTIENINELFFIV